MLYVKSFCFSKKKLSSVLCFLWFFCKFCLPEWYCTLKMVFHCLWIWCSWWVLSVPANRKHWYFCIQSHIFPSHSALYNLCSCRSIIEEAKTWSVRITFGCLLTRYHCDLVYIQYIQSIIVCLVLLELVSSMILHFVMVCLEWGVKKTLHLLFWYFS